jgi:hypothetical protein
MYQFAAWRRFREGIKTWNASLIFHDPDQIRVGAIWVKCNNLLHDAADDV